MESSRPTSGYGLNGLSAREPDGLTRLMNREAASDIVDASLEYFKTAAVMLLDLDRFYLINESYGTALGDAVLAALGQRFLHARGLSGYPVCRYGGNTFLFVLDEEDVEAQAERIRKVAELPLSVQQRELQLSVSCGIAQAPYHGKHASDLLRHSDTALQIAKASRYGAESVAYSLELGQTSCRRSMIEGGLRRALELEQLRIMFQPQYSAEDGRLRGVEALLRWHHPELGAVSPAEFVPIAEQTGLIRSIGEWMIRTAGLQYSRLRELAGEGHSFRLSVNLSAVQLSEPSFANRLLGLLQEVGLPPACLELEITESCMLEQMDQTVQQLRWLRQAGIRIALDDFGTGYSSLSYLSWLPADVLKLDKSFVQPAEERAAGWLIAETMVRLARELGLEVVAEGVETDAQLELVRAWGCDAVQGYLLCRPVDSVDLSTVITARSS